MRGGERKGEGRIKEEKGWEGCGEGMKLEINEGLGEREREESGSLQGLGSLLCACCVQHQSVWGMETRCGGHHRGGEGRMGE